MSVPTLPPLEQDIPHRKIPPQSVVLRLRERETFSARPGTHFHVARQFYKNVFPNFTVTNVEKPPCYLRKFSPSGKYFIAFSLDQTSLEIYEFKGSDTAGDLLRDANSEQHVLTGSERFVQDIRLNIFNTFFTKKSSTILARSGEQLNRECSLFTCDGKYVIVGAAKDLHEARHPLTSNLFRNNEAITGFRNHVETYTLSVVELATGRVTDSKVFLHDKIFLSHNQGIYLYKSTLAVLCVQQQSIHIFQMTDEGTFLEVRTIGRFCHEDDYLVHQLGVRGPQQAYKEQTINSLKHRLLVHLYRMAVSSGEAYTLRRFYQYFDHFLGLRMWKMQLLDEHHLLIKYASEDVVTLQIQDPNSQPSFFMVYNMQTTQVLGVFENTSDELAQLFENFCDMFRNASLYYEVDFGCSSSSNSHARQIQQRFRQTIVNAKFGGHLEATRRVLSQLPISAQSYTSSPYVDLSLYSYDDKWVSVLERPKNCGDHPIRFYCRDSGLLHFKIFTSHHRVQPSSSKRLVAFVFHPFEPFAISIQRTNQAYMVNFHLRHTVT
ncbi:DET1 homolog [Littorina saxatilis]|uniref:DET1 homolog n=1 Tax=Littorina saxatilis TaxID=31220 RepID=A0AAN9C6K3_9CAEN